MNSLHSSSESQRTLADEIFDTVREPMLVLDTNLRVQRASEPFYDHFQVSPEDTVGRLVYELGNGQWDIPVLRTLLEDVLPDDKVFNDFEVHHEFEGIGTKVIQLNARRIDHLQLILLAMDDITKKKEADTVRQSDMEELRMLADSMPHLVWTATADGTVDFVNQRRHEFKSLSKHRDGTFEWLPVVHPDDQDETVKTWKSALYNGNNYQMEHRLQCQDGSYRWHLTLASPARNQQGHIKKWYGSATDIENMKEVEHKLSEAQQKAESATVAKSQFLANMSHEIRTPMTVFLSALEHLAQIDDNPQHQKLLKMADKSAKHLRELIDDILDFSQIEAGHIELYEEQIDLRSWVDDAMTMLLPLTQEKDLLLSCEVKKRVPSIIQTDATRLKQVLTNLVGNAIKFTPEGEVKVTVDTFDSYLEIVVADTGIGVPQEKQKLLFKSFSQVDSSLQRQYDGTGLGLAISKELVELMGGKISLQSREGEGSEFTFSVPLKGTSNNEEPTEAETTTDAAVVRNILLVEDDLMIRDLFLMGLARKDWHVEVAGSGEEALEKSLQNSFDIVLMDLQMPGMDGLEATRRIRDNEDPDADRVCIVGLTAHARKKILEDCIKAGMDEILTKPISVKEVEKGILRCLKMQKSDFS